MEGAALASRGAAAAAPSLTRLGQASARNQRRIERPTRPAGKGVPGSGWKPLASRRRRTATTMSAAPGAEFNSSSISIAPSQHYTAPLSLETEPGWRLQQLLLQNAPTTDFEAVVSDILAGIQVQKDALAVDTRAYQEKRREQADPQSEWDRDMAWLTKKVIWSRAVECRSHLEDVVYAMIVQRFRDLGVCMMPSMARALQGSAKVNISFGEARSAQLESIHSDAARVMLAEHVARLFDRLNPPANKGQVRLLKRDVADMYRQAIVYGYFLRRVSARYQMEMQMEDEARVGLERLFGHEAVVVEGCMPHPELQLDTATATAEVMTSSAEVSTIMGGTTIIDESSTPTSANATTVSSNVVSFSGRRSLQEYVQACDKSIIGQAAFVITMEARHVIERHMVALFGFKPDVKRGEQAGDHESVHIGYPAFRRMQLEAVAFGAYLHQVEAQVALEVPMSYHWQVTDSR
eukprot:jgi/Chlat1/8938/Chrsp94S08248